MGGFKRWTLAVVTTLLLLAGGQQVLAANSELRQKILPLDCIFETIDVGTGELKYLTPEECGVLVPPTPSSVTETEIVVDNGVSNLDYQTTQDNQNSQPPSEGTSSGLTPVADSIRSGKLIRLGDINIHRSVVVSSLVIFLVLAILLVLYFTL